MDFAALEWLHDFGFALHWLHKKSKMPIGQNWQQGPRKSWKELKDTYSHGQNVGVRTGEPSKLSDGTYLHILDIDIKSSDPEDAKAAYGMAEKFIGCKLEKAPRVTSGRGGYSLHIYFRSKTARPSFNLFKSKKLCEVLMPSVKAGKSEALMPPKRVAEGYRWRPSFEIDVLGTGKQAVIPPSIHPDSGKMYKWKMPIAEVKDIPLVGSEKFKTINQTRPAKPTENLKFKEVDLDALRLSAKCRGLIDSLEGLEDYGSDRSAALFAVISEMTLKNHDDSTIISVLVDPLNGIAEVLHDRGRDDFDKAANWLLPQIAKAREGVSADSQFGDIETTEPVDLFEGTDWEVKEKIDGHRGDEGWKTDLDKNANGGFKMNLKNVRIYLNEVAKVNEWLGKNLFTGEVEFIGEPPWDRGKAYGVMKGSMLSDEDVIACRLFLSQRQSFEPTSHLMLEALMTTAEKNSFHPVRSWLKTLKWDGKPRVDKWMHDYLGAEQNAYTAAVGRKLLVASVKRVFKPGCKFDHMVILEGEQDLGKSTALRVLSEPWFCDSLGDVTNKDVIGQIQGAWIVEAGELAAMDKASVNALKEFITKQEDKARMAYARLAKKFPRQCVLVGTTNDDEYLKDHTGNRRFWPVEVGKSGPIKVKELRKVKEQLWAEAMHIYAHKTEKLWLDTPEVKALAKAVQKSKMISDPWDEVIAEWIAETQSKRQNSDRAFRTNSNEIWFQAFNRTSHAAISRQDQMRVANSLKRLGFRKIKTQGKIVWEQCQ